MLNISIALSGLRGQGVSWQRRSLVFGPESSPCRGKWCSPGGNPREWLRRRLRRPERRERGWRHPGLKAPRWGHPRVEWPRRGQSRIVRYRMARCRAGRCPRGWHRHPVGRGRRRGRPRSGRARRRYTWPTGRRARPGHPCRSRLGRLRPRGARRRKVRWGRRRPFPLPGPLPLACRFLQNPQTEPGRAGNTCPRRSGPPSGGAGARNCSPPAWLAWCCTARAESASPYWPHRSPRGPCDWSPAASS